MRLFFFIVVWLFFIYSKFISLYQIYGLQLFYPACSLTFFYPINSLLQVAVLILLQSILSVFPFMIVVLVSSLRTLCLVLDCEDYLMFYFLNFL